MGCAVSSKCARKWTFFAGAKKKLVPTKIGESETEAKWEGLDEQQYT
jgi:hypothetical protein